MEKILCLTTICSKFPEFQMGSRKNQLKNHQKSQKLNRVLCKMVCNQLQIEVENVLFQLHSKLAPSVVKNLLIMQVIWHIGKRYIQSKKSYINAKSLIERLNSRAILLPKRAKIFSNIG